jgi:hypothetical protein
MLASQGVGSNTASTLSGASSAARLPAPFMPPGRPAHFAGGDEGLRDGKIPPPSSDQCQGGQRTAGCAAFGRPKAQNVALIGHQAHSLVRFALGLLCGDSHFVSCGWTRRHPPAPSSA